MENFYEKSYIQSAVSLWIAPNAIQYTWQMAYVYVWWTFSFVFSSSSASLVFSIFIIIARMCVLSSLIARRTHYSNWKRRDSCCTCSAHSFDFIHAIFIFGVCSLVFHSHSLLVLSCWTRYVMCALFAYSVRFAFGTKRFYTNYSYKALTILHISPSLHVWSLVLRCICLVRWHDRHIIRFGFHSEIPILHFAGSCCYF